METLIDFEKFRKGCKEEDEEKNEKENEFENEWNTLRNEQPKTERYKPKSIIYSTKKRCPLCNNILRMREIHYMAIYNCDCGYKYAKYSPPGN